LNGKKGGKKGIIEFKYYSSHKLYTHSMLHLITILVVLVPIAIIIHKHSKIKLFWNVMSCCFANR